MRIQASAVPQPMCGAVLLVPAAFSFEKRGCSQALCEPGLMLAMWPGHRPLREADGGQHLLPAAPGCSERSPSPLPLTSACSPLSCWPEWRLAASYLKLKFYFWSSLTYLSKASPQVTPKLTLHPLCPHSAEKTVFLFTTFSFLGFQKYL